MYTSYEAFDSDHEGVQMLVTNATASLPGQLQLNLESESLVVERLG